MVSQVSDHRLHTIHRFRVPEAELDGWRSATNELLVHWRDLPGWVTSELLRNLDEPDLWLLTSQWADVGSYRRHGLGGLAKMLWLPVMRWLVDEPSAYLSPEDLEWGV